MKELLLEIGTEEIPSGYIIPAVQALKKSLAERLDSLNLSFTGIETYSTPRRLAVCALDIPDKQERKVVKSYGPPKKAAYAKDGSLTKAAIGFAKSKGANVTDIKVEDTAKGEYIYVELEEGGANTIDLLAKQLPKLILGIPFPKSMRWGDGDIKFTRPIHWIMAVYGGETVKFSIDGVSSGATTRGHRFMGSTSIEINGGGDYIQKLKDNFVIADFDLRKKTVLDGARSLAEKNGAKLLEDDDLAETVACLTEWPVALWGGFDEKFLDLPDELLIASMKNHQKMFSVTGSDGKLINGFIGVSNMKVDDDKVVVAGYQRVLAARLADGKFFLDEDMKTSLDSFAKKLDKVVYHKKLGMVGEKVKRLTSLAGYIAEKIKPESIDKVKRTAALCKADLETLMVYEFPELQGVVGREYGLKAGEDRDVCEAIYEHYMPRWSGDALPPSDIGAIVALADKIDTLAGCFGVGLIPTGAADPFALRRGALGVIQIIFEKQYTLDLGDLFDNAIGQLKGKLTSSLDETRDNLFSFFAGRIKNLWTGRGVPYDVADAVIAVGFSDLASALLRCTAMVELKKHDFFEPLAITFKRAGNITKGHTGSDIDESLFEADAEKALYKNIMAIASEVEKLTAEKNFLPALEKIAGLRGVVDKFFDDVMVMADDEKVRENRLNLLQKLTSLFGSIADFSKIVA
ncbi:Glycyl-tRNA synthetase beta chain [hydrothermal vent metagenome]|uniref:glycine--tRNA ligase n=1 Tax=hydrothermal vent metagenome TaxID=652676 RepID=A0A3B1BBD2_9ZZZZ